MNGRKREVHERVQTPKIIFLSIAVKIARKQPIMYRQRIANLANENVWDDRGRVSNKKTDQATPIEAFVSIP